MSARRRGTGRHPVRGSSLLAAAMALAASSPLAPVLAASEDAAAEPTPFAPSLSLPIDLLTDKAADLPEWSLDPSAAAPDATQAERALGAFQRGLYVTARNLAAPLAEDGDAAMQALLGHIHARGLGVRRDPDTALGWMRKAAGNGDPGARHELAIRMIEGSGVERDEAGARAMLRELADAGRVEAAYDLAQLLLMGPPDPERRREGLDRLRAAAEAGMTEARYALAVLLAEVEGSTLAGDTPEARAARTEALRWMVAAARAGMGEAQLELGVWLVTGRTGRQDLASAFGWIERAALGGLPLARNRLARMHWQGLGTEGDVIAAVRWHLLARMGGIEDRELDDMMLGLSLTERALAAEGLPRLARIALPDAVETAGTAPPRVELPVKPRSDAGALPSLPGVRDLGDITTERPGVGAEPETSPPAGGAREGRVGTRYDRIRDTRARLPSTKRGRL